jgi:anhydro-N-acetylmuramic acid kinase
LNQELLNTLNDLPYYQKPAPKSLANEWGTDVVYPLIQSAKLSSADASYTYCKHIAHTLAEALHTAAPGTLFVSGGGAHHLFLMQCIREALQAKQIEVMAAEKELIDSKEALVMALMGALRWREEVNVVAQTSGASRNSVGGALWMGQD